MTCLTPRHLLAGAAAVGAASALSPLGALSVRAAAPPTTSQAPGFYRYKVGTIEGTSINDGARTFPMPDKFVTNVSKDEALAAADAAYMPRALVTVPFIRQLIIRAKKFAVRV